MSKTPSTTAAFTPRFKAMHASGTKSAELVQEVGLAVMEHFQMHQDATLVNSFFLALPPGINYRAVTVWLLEHAALRLNNGPHKEIEPFRFHKEKPTDIEGAKAKPWYTVENADKPKAPSVIDIKASLLSLVKRAAKADKLEGNFEALRAAALSLGVAESEMPSKTEAALAASQAALDKKAKAKKAEIDPLEAVTA